MQGYTPIYGDIFLITEGSVVILTSFERESEREREREREREGEEREREGGREGGREGDINMIFHKERHEW